MILRRQGENQPRVWGSGFIGKPAPGEEPARLDVLAVRGRYRDYTVPSGEPVSLTSVVDAVTERYVAPEGLSGLQHGLVRVLRDV